MVDEMSGADAVARGRLPPELTSHCLTFITHPASEDVRVVPESAQDLRELRRMTEGIGDVGHACGAAKLARAPQSLLKIADDRLAGDEEEIGEDMPWPNEEAIRFDERLDTRAVSRALLEIVLDRDRLSVECERAEFRVALEKVEEARHHRDEPRTVTLEALVPLAVPVRVGDHEGAPPEPAPRKRDDHLGRGERTWPAHQRVKRARSPNDQLQDLGEPPRAEHREHDRARRGDPAAVQPARTEKKERQDPPEKAVPVEVRDGDRDHRGDRVPLRSDREVELSVEVSERGEKIVQRERTWRQTNRPTPRKIRPATM